MRPLLCVVLLATASLFAIAAPQAQREPSPKAELLELVNGRVPSRVIAEVVLRYGISFEPTEEVLNEFRKAGADEVIIGAMRASWNPEWTKLLSDKDILELAEHMPGERIVSMVQQCGITFQPSDEYLQRLRSSGAKDDLIDALRTAATRPFTSDNLIQLLAGGEDPVQIGKGVQERGIDFDSTQEDLGKLRGAGASEPLLQAIREAKRVKPGHNQLPNAPESTSLGPTGTRAIRGPMRARAICPPALSSIPVFSRPDDTHAVIAHLECDERLAILERDSGKVGIDKVLLAGRTEGFTQDFYLSGPVPPGRPTAPVPTYKPEPPYTERARHAKIQGSVTVQFVVDTQGNVTDVKEVSKPLGGGLDENAIETVKTWKFKPGTRDGVPVAIRVRAEITFRLFH